MRPPWLPGGGFGVIEEGDPPTGIAVRCGDDVTTDDELAAAQEAAGELMAAQPPWQAFTFFYGEPATDAPVTGTMQQTLYSAEPAVIAEAFERLRAAHAGCPTLGEAGGEPRYGIAPLEVPTVGDDRFAVLWPQALGQMAGMSMGQDQLVVVFRDGPVLAGIQLMAEAAEEEGPVFAAADVVQMIESAAQRLE